MASAKTPRFSWEEAFSKVPQSRTLAAGDDGPNLVVSDLAALKEFLDWTHIKFCLLKPYFEHGSYPLVESRELLPSFDSDAQEYRDLPGFSMVALARPLDYFSEIFQFDILHNVLEHVGFGLGPACPLEQSVLAQNLRTFLDRMPKPFHEDFRRHFARRDLTALENYPRTVPYLAHMDRAHVMSLDSDGAFYLSGVYASFPSDLDTEIKRYGLRMKKFTPGDNVRYELHRSFVYQFLMELYGFAIVSERRTSSALFARRLFRLGESFLVRVLGQSDRTITTLWSHPEAQHYPRVEKLALVQVDKEQKDAIRTLSRGRYFVDRERRVVILRVVYRQHKYDPNNVQQDRALSVLHQEVVHPLTGRATRRVNLIKDTTNMFLRLNDIVRGEYAGRIVYKRNEVVENTDTHEKRLKFLYSWLSKHQRRIIAYSEEFYAKVVRVLDGYLLNPDNLDVFQAMHELHQEVWAKYSYIRQARKVKLLDDLHRGPGRGRTAKVRDRLELSNQILHELKFEIVNYFEMLVQAVIDICEHTLHDGYLVSSYVSRRDEDLTRYGQDVKKQYGRMVALLDEFKAIRRSRAEYPAQARAV
ncbi:MAG: hypothetical protein AB1916_04050 [Thermodesulfobacteriota bacterium]